MLENLNQNRHYYLTVEQVMTKTTTVVINADSLSEAAGKAKRLLDDLNSGEPATIEAALMEYDIEFGDDHDAVEEYCRKGDIRKAGG